MSGSRSPGQTLKLNSEAQPTIQFGPSVITGIPSCEDIRKIVREELSNLATPKSLEDDIQALMSTQTNQIWEVLASNAQDRVQNAARYAELSSVVEDLRQTNPHGSFGSAMECLLKEVQAPLAEKLDAFCKSSAESDHDQALLGLVSDLKNQVEKLTKSVEELHSYNKAHFSAQRFKNNEIIQRVNQARFKRKEMAVEVHGHREVLDSHLRQEVELEKDFEQMAEELQLLHIYQKQELSRSFRLQKEELTRSIASKLGTANDPSFSSEDLSLIASSSFESHKSAGTSKEVREYTTAVEIGPLTPTGHIAKFNSVPPPENEKGSTCETETSIKANGPAVEAGENKRICVVPNECKPLPPVPEGEQKFVGKQEVIWKTEAVMERFFDPQGRPSSTPTQTPMASPKAGQNLNMVSKSNVSNTYHVDFEAQGSTSPSNEGDKTLMGPNEEAISPYDDPKDCIQEQLDEQSQAGDKVSLNSKNLYDTSSSLTSNVIDVDGPVFVVVCENPKEQSPVLTPSKYVETEATNEEDYCPPTPTPKRHIRAAFGLQVKGSTKPQTSTPSTLNSPGKVRQMAQNFEAHTSSGATRVEPSSPEKKEIGKLQSKFKVRGLCPWPKEDKKEDPK